MDYQKHYQKLIDSRKSLNRDKSSGNYEKHHIIPRCIDGSNQRENLILLTPKEHFIAHLLLTKMYSGKIKAKMCYALLKMCSCNPNQKRKISSRQYDTARKLVSENCRGMNSSFYGKHLSSENKMKISERMKGKNNPSYKYGVWNTGQKLPPISDEHKRRISEANMSRIFSDETKLKMSKASKGKPKSESHRMKLSEINLGKKLSSETKLKMSTSRKGIKQKKIKCPHCGKEGGVAMHRWHFDNCKFL